MALREQTLFVFGTLTAIFAVFFNVALAFLMDEFKNASITAEGVTSVTLAVHLTSRELAISVETAVLNCVKPPFNNDLVSVTQAGVAQW